MKNTLQWTLLVGLLTYCPNRLKAFAIKLANHLTVLGCTLSYLGLTIESSKQHKQDELPPNGSCCPCDFWAYTVKIVVPNHLA